MVREVLVQDVPQMGLRAPGGRTVVVGQIEVRDAQVEGVPHDLAERERITRLPEVLPEPE
jgi:hypothetical protein